ncbi:MAG TPA: sigma factor, partial [Thermoanaerobaculia bacterium]|nr:sigma factor [Thermoanaerobaculia bacterium]
AAVKSGDGDVRARALETLAEAYWRPVYAYVRLKAGQGHEEAADLTQEFFARLVEKDWLARFDASKARLRTYLRVLLDGLVANERKATGRVKRGGGMRILPLDFDEIRHELEGSRAGDAPSPEDIFEREWVRSVFSMAVERFRERCESGGHALRFALFSAYDLDGDAAADRPRYEDLACRFGTTAVDVTNQLAAARRDFRRVVLDLLRELTVSDAEFRAEARALLGVEPPA